MKERLLNTAKNRLLVVSLVCMGMLSIVATENAGAEIDCEGSRQAYARDPNMQNYVCTCPNGAHSMPVCKSRSSSGGRSSSSSGQSSSRSNSGGLSSKNKMKLQMFQGLFDGLMQGLDNSIANAQHEKESHEARQEAQRKADAELERDRAEWRAKTERQIKELEAEYKQTQQQKVDERKSKILADLKGMDTTDSNNPPASLRQLSCNAYWGMKAAKASLAGDDYTAREYSRFSEKPDAAAL